MTRRNPPEGQINIRLPVDLVDNLEEFCKNRRVKKKEIVELALRRFLRAEGDKQP